MRRRAFTLVELLVAMAILTVLLLTLSRVFFSIAETTQRQARRQEATEAARSVLDRIGHDLRTLITQGGGTFLATPSASGNDEISFLTLARPNAATSGAGALRMARIRYRVEPLLEPGQSVPIPTLTRTQEPVRWLSADYDLPAVLRRTPTAQPAGVGPGVFRFEVVWLRRDGSITRNPGGPMATGGDTETLVDLAEIHGFIVSLAVSDRSRLERAASDTPALLGSFPGVPFTSTDRLPGAEWQGAIPTAQPLYIRQNVHIFQRSYYLWK